MNTIPARLCHAAGACLVAVVASLAAGCATVPPDAGKNPADPWEPFNRQVFEFNDTVDRAVIKPLAEGYEAVVPEPARDCIGNVLSNLRDVPTALNNLLQAKPLEAVSDICRVAVNTTVGLLGCFDVASWMGLEKNYQDFGLTLAHWGFDAGPYFVIPLLGPSTVRDAIGRVPGTWLNPQVQLRWVTDRPWLFTFDVLDTRSRLLPAERAFEASALDRYGAVRDAYLQFRRNLLYDGAAPSQAPPSYEDPDDETPPAKPGVSPETSDPAQPSPAHQPTS